MAFTKEYKDFGSVTFKGSKVFVHKTVNYKLEIELGSGKVVEMATWAGDCVNVIYLEGKTRRTRRGKARGNEFRSSCQANPGQTPGDG